MIVAARRKKLGLSQADLAKLVGVSRGRVGQWETGDPIPNSQLDTIAKALDMDVTELTGAARPIRGQQDHKTWRRLVYQDHSLDGTVQTILMFMTEMLVGPEEVEYRGSMRRIWEDINAVTEAEVRAAWPLLLESQYVTRDTDAEWILRLVFPPKG